MMSRWLTTTLRIGIEPKREGTVYICSGVTPRVLRSCMSPRLRNGSAADTHPASPKYVNQPVSPCSSGVAPVYEVVIADAVVEGKTDVIDPRRRLPSSLAPRRCR